MNRQTRIIAACSGILLLAAAGCGNDAGPATLLDDLIGSTPLIGDMRRSVAYERYEMPRPPVEGTVPSASPGGDAPPPFTVEELGTVAAGLENPLPASEAVLFRGERVYEIYCAVCHAEDGGGRGPIVGPNKFPVERTLVGPSAQALSDGYIYGIVRTGRGFMPEYGSRITHEDRWAVAHYVRELQRRANGAPDAGAPGRVPVETELDPEDAAEAGDSPVPGADDADEDAEAEAPVIDVLPDEG